MASSPFGTPPPASRERSPPRVPALTGPLREPASRATSSSTTSSSSPSLIEPVVVSLGQVVLTQPRQTPETPGRLELYGTNGTTGNRPFGINYRSSIVTPQNYWSTYPNGTVDKGGFRWVQMIQAGTTRTLLDGTVQREVYGPETRNQSVFWTLGLDTVYPYEPTEIMPNTFVLPSSYGDGLAVYVANGGKDANGTRIGLDEASDTPGFSLHRTDAWTGTSTVQSFHARDDFTVYQIYRPPGADSQFVPVQSFHWWWGGDVNWFGVPGQERWDQPFPPFNAPPAHGYDGRTGLTTVAFPEWTHICDQRELFKTLP